MGLGKETREEETNGMCIRNMKAVGKKELESTCTNTYIKGEILFFFCILFLTTFRFVGI